MNGSAIRISRPDMNRTIAPRAGSVLIETTKRATMQPMPKSEQAMSPGDGVPDAATEAGDPPHVIFGALLPKT